MTSKIRVGLDVSAVPPRPAGAGRYIIELARHLSQRDDLEVHLYASRADNRWRSIAPNAVLHKVVPKSRFMRLLFGPAILSRVTRGKLDLTHGPHYTPLPSKGVPHVVTVHDLTFFTHPQLHTKMKVKFFRRAIVKAVDTSDGVICVSNETARQVRDNFSFEREIRVIEHGIDHQKFNPESSPNDDAIVKQMGIENPFIFFLGTLEPRKGIVDLINAFSQVADKKPSYELVLAGQKGWHFESIADALKNSPVRNRIKLIDYIDDVYVSALLRKSEVFAYPSVAEGFGLPVLEALACGAAVVTRGDSAHVSMFGKAVVLADDMSVEALADALVYAADDENNRSTMRADGEQLAARFTWESTAEQHAQLYQELLDRP